MYMYECVCVLVLCVQVQLVGGHLKQLALAHSEAGVRTTASLALEHIAQCHPMLARDTLLPPLLQLLTPGVCVCECV